MDFLAWQRHFGARLLPSDHATRLAGDFDLNNRVDGMDLLIWQANFGSASVPIGTLGDGDFDCDVDGADMMLWQRNYGRSQ